MYSVINYGVSDFDSYDLLNSNVLHEVASFQPNLVIVILSGNDITPSNNLESIIQNISDIAYYCLDLNINVKVMQMLYRHKPRGFTNIQYTTFCNEINRQMRKISLLITFYSGLSKSNIMNYLQSDGVI